MTGGEIAGIATFGGNIVVWLAVLYNQRRNNGRDKNMCVKHETDLGTQKTQIKYIEKGFEDFKEQNSEEHGRIFSAIKERK